MTRRPLLLAFKYVMQRMSGDNDYDPNHDSGTDTDDDGHLIQQVRAMPEISPPLSQASTIAQSARTVATRTFQWFCGSM